MQGHIQYLHVDRMIVLLFLCFSHRDKVLGRGLQSFVYELQSKLAKCCGE